MLIDLEHRGFSALPLRAEIVLQQDRRILDRGRLPSPRRETPSRYSIGTIVVHSRLSVFSSTPAISGSIVQQWITRILARIATTRNTISLPSRASTALSHMSANLDCPRHLSRLTSSAGQSKLNRTDPQGIVLRGPTSRRVNVARRSAPANGRSATAVLRACPQRAGCPLCGPPDYERGHLFIVSGSDSGHPAV